MMSARSSRLAIIRSNQRRRIWERSLASFFDQVRKASSAASTARVASAAPKRGTRATISPVAGLPTDWAGSPIHWPPTRQASTSRLGSLSFRV
jgi:hypothetical protein